MRGNLKNVPIQRPLSRPSIFVCLTGLRAPLHDLHLAAGATMIGFGGWEMPLRYAGIGEEHLSVRRDAGVFDVSHMGKILISGSRARDFLHGLSTNSVPAEPSRARYTHLPDRDGHILDDVIITCLDADRYLLVCNAAPRERVLAWLRAHAQDVAIEDFTMDYLCLALQGPKAARILQLLTSVELEGVKGFRAAYCDLLLGERLGTSRDPRVPPEAEGRGRGKTAPVDYLSQAFAGGGAEGDGCLVTRTGYTGEDGFELFPSAQIGAAVWTALLAAGRDSRLRSAGLGARDTLRLEKGFLLSGADFDGRQTPLEASSERLVKWDHEFVGRDALRRQKTRGGYDRLVGLLARDRGVPRRGCAVARDGREVGIVTSGTFSPSLRIGIALGYVRPDFAREGTDLSILVRGRPVRAVVRKPPFL